MYGWDITANLSITPKDRCVEQDSPFGDPLWHVLPIDSSSEDIAAPFLNSKKKTKLTKDQASYMNELKEIWDESSRKSVQSMCCESEDETTNSSLNESRISLQKTDLECPRQKEGLIISLAELVNSIELAEKKCSQVTSQLVNEKKGFINIFKLADMIAESLKMESHPL